MWTAGLVGRGPGAIAEVAEQQVEEALLKALDIWVAREGANTALSGGGRGNAALGGARCGMPLGEMAC